MKNIYLDNAATTQVAKEVANIISDVNSQYFGNPSSIHSVGQEARKIVDDGRRFVSFFVGCEPDEIVFTSGGSESDNLAIRGIVEAVIPAPKGTLRVETGIQAEQTTQLPGSQIKSGMTARTEDDNCKKPHVITSAVEHHAVLHTIQDLEKEGKIEATYIKPDSDGIISVKSVEDAIRDNTILVSIMYVNNETGVVSPIREIGLMLEKENSHRKSVISTSHSDEKSPAAEKNMGSLANTRDDKKSRKILFHTDAVQAAEFFEISPEYLKVDLLTFTAHKLHGPKGIGVLYVRKNTPIKPQIVGGSQELQLRAGTENISGIAGLHKALDLILKERSDLPAGSQIKSGMTAQGDSSAEPQNDKAKGVGRDDIATLRDKLENSILQNISDTKLNGSKTQRAPHITNISFINVEGEAIVLNLDFLGIAVSSGSACTSRSLDPSHVLMAMGIPPEKAHGSIRFSLSRYTTEEEIDEVLKVLPKIIAKLRLMSPFGN